MRTDFTNIGSIIHAAIAEIFREPRIPQWQRDAMRDFSKRKPSGKDRSKVKAARKQRRGK